MSTIFHVSLAHIFAVLKRIEANDLTAVLVQNVGMSPRIAQVLGGCINMMFMFGSILPSVALDRMGRRKTMMIGCASLGFCMMFISALLSQASNPTRGHACASASVTFFFLYMLFFGMSVNCVPWVYVPEILPLEARTKGTAIGISSNWLWNFTVVSRLEYIYVLSRC